MYSILDMSLDNLGPRTFAVHVSEHIIFLIFKPWCSKKFNEASTLAVLKMMPRCYLSWLKHRFFLEKKHWDDARRKTGSGWFWVLSVRSSIRFFRLSEECFEIIKSPVASCDFTLSAFFGEWCLRALCLRFGAFHSDSCSFNLECVLSCSLVISEGMQLLILLLIYENEIVRTQYAMRVRFNVYGRSMLE